MRTSILKLTAIMTVLVLMVAVGHAQRETYQATARGEGTQMGQMFSVNIIINEYSSQQDQQILLQAFDAKGSQGLYNALYKMPSKGHIAITGTIGYDISYARVFPLPNGGKKIRILTTRPISMGEVWADSVSQDYNLSALELDIVNGKGDKGLLYPACNFSIGKDRELQINLNQNPWNLVDVIDWNKK